MKKLLLALALLFIPAAALAQCNGVFPNNTACGNVSGGSNTPRPIPLSSFPANAPGGLIGNVQTNGGGGTFAGITNTQLTALIDQFTSLLSGAVPASGGGTTNFLRADGTWAPIAFPTPVPAAGWGVLYPHSNQTFAATAPWIALDPYGNAIDCTGTQTQCAQEFIIASIHGGWPALMIGQGIRYTTQNCTLNSTTTVVCPTTIGLVNGSIVSGLGIPSGVTYTIVNGTTITLSMAATASGSAALQFTTSTMAPLLLNATLQIPAAQQWSWDVRDVQLAAFPAVTTGVIAFDSMEVVGVRMYGSQITWGPASPASACAVTFNPTHPTPIDSIIGVTASEFYLGNIAAGNAFANLCLLATNGGIGGNVFASVELYSAPGTTRGLYLDGAGTSRHIEANRFDMPYIHDATAFGICVACAGGTPGFYVRNTFNVGIAPGAPAATCISLNGSINTITGSCTNAEAGGAVANGVIFATGTAGNHYDWTTSGVTTPKTDNGSNANGWVN